jgi:hypothetical protein
MPLSDPRSFGLLEVYSTETSLNAKEGCGGLRKGQRRGLIMQSACRNVVAEVDSELAPFAGTI